MGYKVKSGDTLTKIAKDHNLSLDTLLAMNNMTREQANKIQIGQDINVDAGPSAKEDWRPPQFGANSPFPNLRPKSNPVPTPYKPDYSEQDYLKDNAASIQEQLIAEKYNVGKWGADGKWGKNSQAAWLEAKRRGYALENGKLVDRSRGRVMRAAYHPGEHILGGYTIREYEDGSYQIRDEYNFSNSGSKYSDKLVDSGSENEAYEKTRSLVGNLLGDKSFPIRWTISKDEVDSWRSDYERDPNMAKYDTKR